MLFRFAAIKRSVVKNTRKINAAKAAREINDIVLVVMVLVKGSSCAMSIKGYNLSATAVAKIDGYITVTDRGAAPKDNDLT